MVDWTSKYAPNGHIITLLHRKKNQGLHRCEDFSTYNNNTKPLASLDNPIEIIYPQITQIIKGLFLHPVWRYMKIFNLEKGRSCPLCCISELHKRRNVPVNSFWEHSFMPTAWANTSISFRNICCQFPQKEQKSKTFGFLLTLFLSQ